LSLMNKRMNVNRNFPWVWQRHLAAIGIVAFAAALRAWPLQALGPRLAWLTFYPAVMLASVFGGFSAGLLATGISCIVVIFLGPILVGSPFIKETADWLGILVFVMTGCMISVLAEGMLRARNRAEKARLEAEAANRAKSIFLANMSHELRTPLNAILVFSTLLGNDPGITEAQRKVLNIINRSGEHLLSLINDVLDMAKVEAGRIPLESGVFDIVELVHEVTDLMRLRAEEKGLPLIFEKSIQGPSIVRSDAPKWRQILINLLGNAIKFTEQGQVVVRLNLQPAQDANRLRLVIEVRDTGIGIEPEFQETIFSPFTQIASTGAIKGTGLGLTITRQFVALMKGSIHVESVPQQGSCFRVEAELERGVPEELAIPNRRNFRVAGIAPGQPPYRVLIVEDQMENWLLLLRLMEDAGFQVQVAENGAQGVVAFETWHPHFIWMDVRMAGMDGLEATRRIRALPGGLSVKIVALTASVFQEERAAILESGMNDLIRKPFQIEDLFRSLEQHLGVQFLIADHAPPIGGPLPPIAPTDLGILPRKRREELVRALTSLDSTEIANAIEGITDENPELGRAISMRAEQLAYTDLLHLLQASLASDEELP